jgi:hypothetical protein
MFQKTPSIDCKSGLCVLSYTQKSGGCRMGQYDSATAAEIKGLLEQFKRAKQKILVGRPKNREFVDRLEITDKEAILIVEHLRVSDYHAGPKPDFKLANESVWEFKKSLKGMTVYIKLQVRKNPIGTAYIISFHEDEY